MAESLNSRFSKQMDRTRGRNDRMTEDEIHEENINIPKSPEQPRKQNQNCSICLANHIVKLSVYLCYVCEVFLCKKCHNIHDQSHSFVKRESKESKRERLAEGLVMDLRSERKIEENLERENVEVYGRVNVKHGLDKEDCWISGLCGLEDKRWAVLDSDNNCMKIFSSVTNTLLRYVRFGSRPRDATEIIQKFTDPNSASGSKSDVSGAARVEQDKHCLLAVTFPYIKQIWFIDVNQSPAVKTKTIEMQKKCWPIDFSEDKIFTLCEEGFRSESRGSVDILSAEGNTLKVIQTDIPYRYYYISDLAIDKDRIYLTDHLNNKVLCINMEDGKTVSQLRIVEGSRSGWLRGISVDPSNNVVYACGWDNNKVYKLSPDLREYEQLNLDTGSIERPDKICFTDNKLFVGHFGLPPSLNNFVTVVQLT